MNFALVRFTRSHTDDDELVFAKAGPYCAYEPFFDQLKAEFESFEGADQITLTHADLHPFFGDGDAYLLYCMVPTVNDETAIQLAARLQNAYDDDAIAGEFQIIWLAS